MWCVLRCTCRAIVRSPWRSRKPWNSEDSVEAKKTVEENGIAASMLCITRKWLFKINGLYLVECYEISPAVESLTPIIECCSATFPMVWNFRSNNSPCQKIIVSTNPRKCPSLGVVVCDELFQYIRLECLCSHFRVRLAPSLISKESEPSGRIEHGCESAQLLVFIRVGIGV